MNAEDLIRLLDLEPHPKEGGFFRETWRSEGASEPGPPFDGRRSHGTADLLDAWPGERERILRLLGE